MTKATKRYPGPAFKSCSIGLPKRRYPTSLLCSQKTGDNNPDSLNSSEKSKYTGPPQHRITGSLSKASLVLKDLLEISHPLTGRAEPFDFLVSVFWDLISTMSLAQCPNSLLKSGYPPACPLTVPEFKCLSMLSRMLATRYCPAHITVPPNWTPFSEGSRATTYRVYAMGQRFYIYSVRCRHSESVNVWSISVSQLRAIQLPGPV